MKHFALFIEVLRWICFICAQRQGNIYFISYKTMRKKRKISNCNVHTHRLLAVLKVYEFENRKSKNLNITWFSIYIMQILFILYITFKLHLLVINFRNDRNAIDCILYDPLVLCNKLFFTKTKTDGLLLFK